VSQTLSQATTLTWFAGHEFRLAWRDWLSMMTAGKRGRERVVAVVLVIFIALMHLFAWSMVRRVATMGAVPDKAALAAVTGSLLLSFSLMLSQAMESVTRAFYARADLELILSSPVEVSQVFAVRIGALTISTALLGLALAAPFINMLAWCGGVRWLAAYGVVAAMGLIASSFAVALTVALFKTIGPKRTRLVAQIVAAVIGAAFVIFLQIAAIQSYGTLSRYAVLQSAALMRHAPEIGSMFWLPARAALGDLHALAGLLGAGLLMAGLTVAVYSPRFGDYVVAAASVAQGRTRQRDGWNFRGGSPMRALRRKEWALLLRDPWLASQTLMQLLYLLPPALLLWKSFGNAGGALVLLVPVLVMAAGQLAGGLAWLAISGEDAPDLVATAPVAAGAILRAKIEAVMAAIALVFAPFLLPLAIVAPYSALTAVIGIAVAAMSSTAIQLWFRTQAKRSHFRRRQTSSRMATFAEAFSSITWAATAALAAAGTWLAVVTGVIALMVIGVTRALAPRAGA
jgi:ABC-2 type transport system permease protein